MGTVVEEVKTPKKRLAYIDLMKGIAIFLVICHHCKVVSYDYYKNDGLIYDINYWLRAWITVSVPLFFFSNGFLLLNQKYDTQKHVKRTLRLVLMTVVWSVLTLLLEIPIMHLNLSKKEFFEIVWNHKTGYLNHMWFMGALVCIYVLYPLIKAAYDHEKKAFYFFLSVTLLLTVGNRFLGDAILFFMNIGGGHGELIDENLFNIFNPFREIYGWPFAYFCMGGLLKGLTPKIEEHRKWVNIIAGILLPTSMTCLFLWGRWLSQKGGQTWDIVFTAFGTLLVFINVMTAALLCMNYKGKILWLRHVFEAIGKETLGIYFIHYIIIYATRAYVKSVPMLRTVPGEMLYAAALLAASMGIVYILKKIPILRQLVMH